MSKSNIILTDLDDPENEPVVVTEALLEEGCVLNCPPEIEVSREKPAMAGWPNWTNFFCSANQLPIQSKKNWLIRPIANPIQSANRTPIGTDCQSANWYPIGFCPIGSQLPIG